MRTYLGDLIIQLRVDALDRLLYLRDLRHRRVSVKMGGKLGEN